MHGSERRRGFSLLEVLAALAILGSVGMAMLVLLVDAQRSLARAGQREFQYREAAKLLEGVARSPEAALRYQVGRRWERGFELRVTELRAGLFVLAVSDSAGHRLLETSVYRRTAARDAR